MYSHLHIRIRMAGQSMTEKFYELMMSQLAGMATQSSGGLGQSIQKFVNDTMSTESTWSACRSWGRQLARRQANGQADEQGFRISSFSCRFAEC